MNESITIKDTISENISLSKFAKCLCVSRPTLYKYMDAYDSKNIDIIPDNILTIFDKISTITTKKALHNLFDEIYANYVNTEERRLREKPIPSEIAEIIDSERIEVKDIDLMIEKATKYKTGLLKKDSVDEDEIQRVTKDIKDLEYTREIVRKRQSENQFVLIFNTNWTACLGPNEEDAIELDEETDAEDKFRFILTRAKTGYTLFFYNDSEGDSVELQLLTGARKYDFADIVGTFRPEPGMKFIRIPDLFEEEYEEFFEYRVTRSNNGNILNRAVGKFTV